jgi:GT2 family glycosyltransferase
MLSVVEADNRIGLASPLILNADASDEVEFAGGLWQGVTFLTTNDIATYHAWAGTFPTQIWLVGTALLLRRQLVEAIGVFDERFFAYWEDNDYSVRSIEAGFRNVVIPDAVLRHWSGRPNTDPASKLPHYFYYMARNEIFFTRKHWTGLKLLKTLWWAWNRQCYRANQLASLPAARDAVFAGLLDGLLGRGGAYEPERKLYTGARQLLYAIAWMSVRH